MTENIALFQLRCYACFMPKQYKPCSRYKESEKSSKKNYVIPHTVKKYNSIKYKGYENKCEENDSPVI